MPVGPLEPTAPVLDVNASIICCEAFSNAVVMIDDKSGVFELPLAEFIELRVSLKVISKCLWALFQFKPPSA